MKRTVNTYTAVSKYFDWEKERVVTGIACTITTVGKPTMTEIRREMKRQNNGIAPTRGGKIELTLKSREVWELSDELFMQYAHKVDDDPDEIEEEEE